MKSALMVFLYFSISLAISFFVFYILNSPYIPMIMLFPVLVVTSYFDTRYGYATAIVSTVTIYFFFCEPTNSLVIKDGNAFIKIFTYLALALAFIVFISKKKKLDEQILLERESKKQLEKELKSAVDAEDTAQALNEELEATNEELEASLASLEAEQVKIQTIVDELPNMLIIKDSNLRYTFINKALCEFLNKSEHELLGKTVFDLLPHEKAEQIWMHEKALLQNNEAQTIEETIIDAKGIARTLISAKKPILTEDGELGLFVVITDITNRKEMEVALANSEARYRTISDKAIVGMYVVQDGKMSYVNQAYADILGYGSPDEIIGKIPVEELVAPKDRDNAEELLKKRFSGEIKDVRYKATLIKKDGSEVFVEAHGAIGTYDDKPAIIGIIIDRTAERKLEVKLRESEDRFKVMFENSHDAIMLQDEKGFIDCNKRALELFGISDKAEFISLSPVDLSPPLQPNGEESLVAANREISIAIEKGSNHFEWESMRKNGEYFFTDVLLSVFEYRGKTIIQATVRDLTQIKAVQQKVREQERMIFAQSRFAAMGEMIGMIAHQWRQPITAIGMGANNMIMDIELGDIEPNSFKKHLESINTQVQFLSNTIDDFRNFFRPNRETTSVRISDIINGALKIIGKSLENSNIEMRKEIIYDHTIEAYESELIQVLLAILGNAKDAMVERKINSPIITVLTIQNPDYLGYVELHICDNGGGVPEELTTKIFEPYFSTKAKNGTGLGLYIAKTIIEKHQGGSIGVRNENDGACFWIRLPIAK